MGSWGHNPFKWSYNLLITGREPTWKDLSAQFMHKLQRNLGFLVLVCPISYGHLKHGYAAVHNVSGNTRNTQQKVS